MGGAEATKGLSTRLRVSRLVGFVFLALGLTGVAVAHASQVDPAWSGKLQAGIDGATSPCQPADTPVQASWGSPRVDPTGETPWTVSEVHFSGIDSNCLGQNYQVSYRVDDEWTVLLPATASWLRRRYPSTLAKSTRPWSRISLWSFLTDWGPLPFVLLSLPQSSLTSLLHSTAPPGSHYWLPLPFAPGPAASLGPGCGVPVWFRARIVQSA